MRDEQREERVLGEAASRVVGCPAADELLAHREGDLPATRREELEAHLVSCPTCRAALEALSDAEKGAGAPARLPEEVLRGSDCLIDSLVAGGGEATQAPRAPARRWVLGLAAAAAIVLVALGLQWSLRSGPSEPRVHREETRAAIGAEGVDGVSLPRESFLLRWSVEAEVSHYDLRVAREDLSPVLAVQGLDRPEHLVDGAALAEIAPGTRLIWQVEAVLPGGQRLRSKSFVTVVE